ncbi:Periplasmic serine endoprotease DegP [Pontiella desulfatans]|uniref:Probable periplasmic serine endoprotease DegP-like n=1 Tax=Pontiella desulfatans TaxID=2750659 RepID=A0A6C2U936_PONDE|nr:DegQ family serine endoprotease [Pontiella desulfatans]VGO15906.1 Periplasmic serine endoprotease DegP [Pontiella desulfatans]
MCGGRYVLVGLLSVSLFATVPVDAGKSDVLRETGSAFSEIAKQALPAVVFIDVETTVEVPRYHSRNPLEQFFGRGYRGYQQEEPETQKYHQQGQGSGFIISKDGYILTNNHVVNDADRITVTLGDGREFDAKLIGADPKTEVALIKIEDGDELPVIELGDSDALDVGEWVLAAGNPFGLSQTITAGIVSAKGRDEVGIAEYGSFIQTDAAINPGNSGGPLLDIDGKAIGINTAIYTRTGGYMGIGFAIPINQAITIKDQLIKHGKVSRSVLGVYIQEVDEDLAKSFGLEETGGILINQVLEESAAAEAGLKEGDIVVEMNGSKVEKLSVFRSRVASTPPNSKLDLKVFRNGKYKNISAITKEMEGEEGAVAAEGGSERYDKLGATVESLESEAARRLGYEDLEGVLVTEVEQGSPAWRAGLQPGQVITSVDRQPVESVREFKEMLAQSESGKILFLVTDGRSSRFVVATIEDD